ncbi:MAG: SGNH/GDSL hydrolase family protein [Pseudomonadota bacterium]
MFKRFIFWLTLPFALPQALWIRKTANRFDGAAGEKAGYIGDGPPCRLLAIGDSLVEGVGASTLDKALVGHTARAMAAQFGVTVHWTAIGQSGARTHDITRGLVPTMPEQPFHVMLISTGVNDVTGLTRTTRFKVDLHKLIAALRQHSTDAQIVLTGTPPMGEFPLLPQPLRAILGLRAEILDTVTQQVADETGSIHVPVDIEPDPMKFADDGYHPSESGYADFGEAISLSLESVNSAFSRPRQNVVPLHKGR